MNLESEMVDSHEDEEILESQKEQEELLPDKNFEPPSKKSGEKFVGYVGPPSKERHVYLKKELSEQIKPHQLEGLKFMWANIVRKQYLNPTANDAYGVILAHCMGLGKTFQVVAFIHTYIRNIDLENRNILIICPVTLIENWIAEFKLWLKDSVKEVGPITSLYSKLNVNERLEVLQKWTSGGGILICGYEIFRKMVLSKSTKEMEVVEKAFLTPGPELVVCDESHKIKNEKSKLSEALKSLKCRRRICLTGYPLQNNLLEYWCMVDFVKPGYLRDQKQFQHNFLEPINRGLDPEAEASEITMAKKKLCVLIEKLKPLVHRKDSEVMERELFPKYEFVISCKLTPKQEEIYKTLISEADRESNQLLFASCVSNLITSHPLVLWQSVQELNAKKKKEALKEREKQKEKDRDDDEEKEKEKDEDIVIQKEVNQELQIIESAGYNSIPKTLELVNKLKEQPDGESLAHSSKLTILMEIVKLCIQRKEKLLIFSQFVLNLNFMEARIAEYNKTTTEKIHHFRLDGTTAQAQRQHMIRAFQKDDSKNVFLISTRAGGLGLNLTAANHVVLFDVNWNPCHDEQALTRVYRYGQQKPVFIYRLQNTSTMEEYIYKNNVKKQGLAKRVVDNIPIRRLYGRSDIDKHYVYEPKQNDDVADPGSDPIMSELLQK